MPRFLYLACLSVLTFRSPGTAGALAPKPKCPPNGIKAKIAELKAQPKANPAYEVWAYKYQGHKVYLVTADCCDQYSTLYDECMQVLCAPTGGITGRGDGRCPQFEQEATDKKLVWRDPRK